LLYACINIAKAVVQIIWSTELFWPKEKVYECLNQN
jgi:hypothetical protein